MISWGCTALDELIGPLDELTRHDVLVHGFNNSGKTTLTVYQAVASLLRHRKHLEDNEVFIVTDTDGGLNFKRFEQILKAWGVDQTLVAKARKNLVYRTFFDFQQQWEFYVGGRSGETLLERIEREKWTPLLIVNDSSTLIYRNIVSKLDPQHRMSGMQPYLGKLADMLIRMLEVSHSYACPVFMVSFTESSSGHAFGGGERAIGGRGLRDICKTILKIRFPWKTQRIRQGGVVREQPIEGLEDEEYGGPERYLVLQKSKTRPSGETRLVYLTEKGFIDPPRP